MNTVDFSEIIAAFAARELYIQNVGIPMGTNCAPLLLMCFYFVMKGTS